LELQPGLAGVEEKLAGLSPAKRDSSTAKIATRPTLDALTVRSKSEKSNVPAASLPSESPEQTWLRFNRNNKKLVRQIERVNANLIQNSFSVVIPVYNPPINCLRECIESVISQSYENYDVIIVDDCSTNVDVRQYLESVAQHPRIKVYWREKNGHISRATNDGAYVSTNNYLVFVDNDDLLEFHALATVNVYINRYSPDILYTDEMRTDATGKDRYGVKFKPGYSPELLLAFCYFSHLVVMKRTIFKAAGGFRAGYEGSQDHDLWLRATELTNRVTHVPQKLYVRRVIPGSTAAGGDQKSYAYAAAEKALQEAFDRRGVACSILRPDWAVKKGYGIYHPVFPHDGLAVHIVVTTSLQPSLTRPFLETLSQTSYKNFRVTFVCKCSDESLFKSRKQEVFKSFNFNFKYEVKLHDCKETLSYSDVKNIAVGNTEEQLILFLSDEVELRRESWLSQMVGWVQLPGVSVVGIKLIDSSAKIILNCGMAHGFNFGAVGPVFKQARVGSRGHQYLAAVTRNVSSVSGSCLLVKSATFKQVGGFDAKHFPDTYSDVDLCYRIADITGERAVQCNEISAIHRKTNNLPTNPIAIAQYKKIYGQRFEPYLNPCINLLRYDMTPSNRIVSEDNEEIRVALISHNLNHEGAPISLFQLALYLAKQPQCSVSVWSPTLGPLKAEYENAGINVLIGIQNSSIEDFVKSINKYGNALEKQTTVFSYIKDKTNCNVVITNTLLNFWAVNAAWDLGVPAVWIIRESEGVTNGRFRRAEAPVVNAVFQAFRNAYKVVYVATETLEVYKQEFDHHNYEVIPNGLRAPDRFAAVNTKHRSQARVECGFGENDFVVCQVGTICKRKNQLELVEAFAEVKNTIVASEMKLLLVGYRKEDNYGRNLVEFVEKQPEKVRSCVKVIAETSDVYKYFKCADIFCFTSSMESYPRVLLEAMAAELPIISTKIMGTKSQIFTGFNGDFYEAGNKHDLALKITSFLLNKEKWESYKKNSQFALKSLMSYNEMGKKYFDILQSAVLYSPS
jgi:glycosyltransferase involved in cell wall biosynthesis